jgi:glyoxylase-like metal-dependent hydrolase (beta-lactamase superfamily II)
VVAPEKPVEGLAEALARTTATGAPGGAGVHGTGNSRRTSGLSPTDIDFVLPTHLHWDHISGMLELPVDLPIRVPVAERDFAVGGHRAPLGVVRGPLHGRTFKPYELDGPPVLTFARSHDLFGDGAVVIVDLAGHTPGSVGVLLALADGSRVLLAGDAVWHRIQVRLLREKAPFPGQLVDADRDLTFATLHRLHALPPEIRVVASHDRDAAMALLR